MICTCAKLVDYLIVLLPNLVNKNIIYLYSHFVFYILKIIGSFIQLKNYISPNFAIRNAILLLETTEISKMLYIT